MAQGAVSRVQNGKNKNYFTFRYTTAKEREYVGEAGEREDTGRYLLCRVLLAS